jgi:DNA polymerase-3 subunit delta
MDEAVDALALGESGDLDRAYRRLVASGTPGFVIAGAALRHFDFLHLARAAYDSGTPAKALMMKARPPIFFQRQARVERQIALWSLPRIERALAHLNETMVESRLRGAISDEVIGQALTLIATLASPGRRGRGAVPS